MTVNRVINLTLILLLVLTIAISENAELPVEIREAVTLPPSLNSNCTCRLETEPLSGGYARIAYLVTVHSHRTIEDAVFLFRAIRSPLNLIFIHIDTKCDWKVYANSTLYTEITACPCGSTVIVESVHSAEWSAWSMNDPTFWGMQQALQRRDDWDVFINLSGDTLPVYTPNVIANLFATDLKGINFVTSSSCETGLLPTNVHHWPQWWHKRNHYTTNPDGDVELDYMDEAGHQQHLAMQIYFGSQWIALQPDFCHYIITSLKRPDSLPSRFRDYLIRTDRLMSDETFLATLLMHVSPFNETSLPIVHENNGSLVSRPSMTALRYERMDENIPDAFGMVVETQRYSVPNSSIVEQPKPWGPYYLGVYDLRAIRQSGALFCRKVSRFVEPNLQHLLPVQSKDEIPDIYWPEEVSVSVKMNWRKRIEELKEEYLREQEEEAKRRPYEELR